MTLVHEAGDTWESAKRSSRYRMDKKALAEFLRTQTSRAPIEAVVSGLSQITNSVREIVAIQPECIRFSFQRIVPVTGTTDSIAFDLEFDLSSKSDCFLLSVLNDMTRIDVTSQDYASMLEQGAILLSQRIYHMHLRQKVENSLR